MNINNFPVNLNLTPKNKFNFVNAHYFFSQKCASFYYNGRNAVWNGMKLLNLTSSQNVLVPSYHCGVEIDAVLKAGIQVKFYKIKSDTSADLEDIKDKVDADTRAIFIIHYFGFPQPIQEVKKICEKHKLFLIEDCAHALFSCSEGKQLGTFGDISIFSIKKSLPVPNGGALVVNIESLKTGTRVSISPVAILRSLKDIVRLLLERLKSRYNVIYFLINAIVVKPLHSLSMVSRCFTRNKYFCADDYRVFNVSTATMGMSSYTERALKRIDINEVIEKRRINYMSVYNEIKDWKWVKALFKKLPDMVCPLFLPILVERRDELVQELLKRGIEPFIFGKTPHALMNINEFPDSLLLSKQNLCLPVHTDMNKNKIEYLMRVLKETLNTINK